MVLSKSLFLPLLLCALVFEASAQTGTESDSSSFSTPEVQVQAARTLLPLKLVARSVSVITAEDIKRQPGISIPDALELVSGVDVRQRGPFGAQSDIGIRGGTFEQTLLLLNGVKITDPQTGRHAQNMPLPLVAIARVEVLKGSASRVFGQNGFAGAVNFVTKDARSIAPTLWATYGQYNLAEIGFATGIQTGKVRHLLSTGYRYTDGYRPNTDLSLSDFFYQGVVPTSNRAELSLTAGYTARHFGAQNFFGAAFPTQYESTEAILTNIGYRSDLGEATKLTLNATWRRHFDDYRSIRENPDTLRNLTASDVLSVDGNLSLPLLGGTASIGFDAREEQLRSNNLGSHRRQSAGVFVEQQLNFGERWFFTPGVYLNWLNGYGYQAYPGIDIAFLPATDIKLFANVGRAYRLPTYVQLYYGGPGSFGNAALKPEEAWSYETGLSILIPGVQMGFQLAAFLRDGSNLIDFSRLKTETSGPFVARNVNDLTTRGYETAITFSPDRIANSFQIRQVQVAYTFIEQSKSSGDYNSAYVFDFLRHQVVSSIDLQLTNSLNLRPVFRYEKRVNVRENYLLDMRLQYEKGHLRVFAEGSNLFNKPYKDVGAVVLPGRWLRAGIVLTIANKAIGLNA